ncbi:hypothetical protein MMC19_002394 [Ptychographa xylographoides]|nr:hypothetical protein [Ptychographa xylographoides]
MMIPSFHVSIAACLCTISSFVQAATVTYDFNITWVTANPDGAFDRPTIGINGQWPIPRISANVGDQVIVNVLNQLGNETTSLHFHGLYMNGTTHMDGPVGVSQCAIPPGATFTYDFKITQPGTYWYHSHANGQYPDGLRGPLIIHDPDSPFKDDYDEELVLTLSDWYHDSMATLIPAFISVTNPTGTEPIPDAALMNDTQNLSILVEPGKTYMVRIVNMAAFASQYFWIEGHTMRVVEVDGIYTEPAEASMLYITAAQRYSFLITISNDTTSNFAIIGSMDPEMFDKMPASLNTNVTSWLVTDKTKALPVPVPVDEFDPFDDFSLVPQDGEELYDDVDYSFTLKFHMGNLGDGANYAFFNNVTYVKPKVPTLYTALSTGDAASSLDVYGSNTNAFILQKDDIVELVLNSADTGKHPFHLHGHAFQAVVRSDEDAGSYAGNVSLPKVPMRRDTFMVRPGGNIVLRFKADNPDNSRIWLFHCHIEWHVDSGLIATLIEAPMELQQSLTIPADHFKVCMDQGLPYTGNAAANTADPFDLTGENVAPAPLPAGFTPRGIVALVFSCLSGVLGIAAIALYGVGELGAKEVAASRRAVAEITEVAT